MTMSLERLKMAIARGAISADNENYCIGPLTIAEAKAAVAEYDALKAENVRLREACYDLLHDAAEDIRHWCQLAKAQREASPDPEHAALCPTTRAIVRSDGIQRRCVLQAKALALASGDKKVAADSPAEGIDSIVQKLAAAQAENVRLQAIVDLVPGDVMGRIRQRLDSTRATAEAEGRCRVCGWPLAKDVEGGCTKESCSMRSMRRP